MTKTAQIAVARGVAESVAGTNVTANSILVGPTASEGVGDFVQSMALKQAVSKEQATLAKAAKVQSVSSKNEVDPVSWTV